MFELDSIRVEPFDQLTVAGCEDKQEKNDPGGQLIASVKEIRGVRAVSLESVLLPAALGRRVGWLEAAVDRCGEFFDWHPILLLVCVLAATTFGFTGLIRVSFYAMPQVDGWPMFTVVNGLVLAILLLNRRILWLWIMAGYVSALVITPGWAGEAHRFGPLQIVGNVSEIMLVAFTLPPFRIFRQWLEEQRLIGAFAAYALVLGPLLKGMVMAARLPGSAAVHVGFWERVRIVGVAEALGIALVTPLVLVLLDRQTYELFRLRALPETAAGLSAVVLASWIAFHGLTGSSLLLILPFAVLVTIVIRLGLRAGVLGLGATALVGLAATHGTSAMAIQTVLALAVLTMLPLAVLLMRWQEVAARVDGLQAEVDKLKSVDRLTGVANRRRFDLVLTREWQRATRDPKPIALLMVEIDFFDEYYEFYGQAAGDECLRLVSSKMADQPHRAYDLVSRYDGGKFGVLLPGASGAAVKRIAEGFRAEIASHEWPHQRSAFDRVTVSVGWASMMPEQGLEPTVLILAAEQALSEAKQGGRNRVESFNGSAVELTAK